MKGLDYSGIIPLKFTSLKHTIKSFRSLVHIIVCRVGKDSRNFRIPDYPVYSTTYMITYGSEIGEFGYHKNGLYLFFLITGPFLIPLIHGGGGAVRPPVFFCPLI